MTQVFAFETPRRILFGLGAREKLGAEIRSLGARSVILVTDLVVRKARLVDVIEEALRQEECQVDLYDDIEPEPTLQLANQVASYSRRHSYDVVVGVGGGSVLDMAKVASMAVKNPGDIRSYLGVNNVAKPSLPKILIPTTAGTGSEVTNVAVVSLTEEELKSSIVSPYAFAEVAIVDPWMSRTMPPITTANTGLDALSHAVEACMSVLANPLTDALAMKAIKLINDWLPIAHAQPENVEARQQMALASLLAGMAFGNAGVCLGHAIAYSFAVKCRISHGASCAIALPYVMEYNALTSSERIASIASTLGLETSGLTSRQAALRAVTEVKRLIQDLKMPVKLKDLNVPQDVLPRLAEDTLKSARLIAHNPREVTRDSLMTLLEAMWDGKQAI